MGDEEDPQAYDRSLSGSRSFGFRHSYSGVLEQPASSGSVMEISTEFGAGRNGDPSLSRHFRKVSERGDGRRPIQFWILHLAFGLFQFEPTSPVHFWPVDVCERCDGRMGSRCLKKIKIKKSRKNREH